MQGYVRFQLPSDDVAETDGPFEADTITELHDIIVDTAQMGAVQGLLRRMFDNREMAPVAIAMLYHNMGGQAIPYTLLVEGMEEPGLADISPAALGAHHWKTLTEYPHLKETMRNHVEQDCGNPHCPVRSFAEALDLTRHFDSPSDGG